LSPRSEGTRCELPDRKRKSSLACTFAERDGVLIAGVRGANAHVLKAMLDRANRDGRPVVVDLQETSYIDSTGLHLLVKAHGTSRAPLAVAFTPDLLSRIFSVLSLQDLIAVYPSVDAAVKALSRTNGGGTPHASPESP